MKIESLKNYGLAESKFMSPLPLSVRMNLYKVVLKLMFKHFGIARLPSVMISIIKEKRKLNKIDLSPLIDRGIDEKFIKSFFDLGAFCNTVLDMCGKEKMAQIYYEFCNLVMKTGFWLVLYPDPKEMKQFDDPFSIFNQYFLAQFEANKKDNCHEFEVIENSNDHFICDVTYCGWYEVYKYLGMDEMAEIFCYVDLVFFPEYLSELGGEWRRPTRISKGDPCCRFEHKRIEI